MALALMALGACTSAPTTSEGILVEAENFAVKGGWSMIVLGVMSLIGFYILFERNYIIRKAGKEDPLFMDKIKDYILGGEIKAAIAYCRSVNTPSARMIEKGITRLGRPVNDVQAAIENVGNI